MAILCLCSPTPELSCFACCPPIRPPGYDHLDHRASLTRLLSENRAAYLAGQTPQKEITGYWCPGLGFLDAAGRRVGCLLHPAVNQGSDLRGPTGYRDKCARESCIEARAFERLDQGQQERLMGLCAGMDPFVFSSRRANPVMRLLGMGPEVAGAVTGLEGLSLEEMDGWAWLGAMDPALGWLLARLVERSGAGLLRAPDVAGRLERFAGRLRQAMGPRPPMDQGQPLHQLMDDQWQARFWRQLTGRQRAATAELAAWRRALEALTGD